MSALLHIAAAVGFLWMAVWGFNDLDVDAIGYVCLFAFLYFLAMTPLAVHQLWKVMQGREVVDE